MVNATFAGIYCGNTQEKQITSRNKSIGDAACGLFLIHCHRGVSQRIMSQCSYERHIHHIKFHFCLSGYFSGEFHFFLVLLTIKETQSVYFFKVAFRPKEASGRILSATEHNQCSLSVHHKILFIFSALEAGRKKSFH